MAVNLATAAATVATAVPAGTTAAAAAHANGTTVAPPLNCSALNATAGDTIPVECSSYSWLIAVAIIVCGTIVNNLGVNVQKWALGLRAKKPPPRIPWKVVWISGIIAIVLGSVCDFLALGFGDQILVTPLTSMTLVWNLFFAALIQKEKISVMDGVWTGVIIAGCVLTVIFASHENTSYSAEQLFAFYKATNFIAYAIVVALLLVGLTMFGKWADRVERRQGVHSAKYKKIAKMHVLSYPCASGLVGAQSISFAKTFVELFTDSFKPGATIFLAQWQTYPLLLAIATTTVLQIYWLNVALAKWPASVVVPTFQSNWMVWSIVAGGVIYDEFAEFDDCSQSVCVNGVSLAWIFFPLGVLVTVFGVVMQSRGGHGGGHGGAHPPSAVKPKSKATTMGSSLLGEHGAGDGGEDAEGGKGAIGTYGSDTTPTAEYLAGRAAMTSEEWGFALPELTEDQKRCLAACTTFADTTLTLSPGVRGADDVPFLGVEFGTDTVVVLDPLDPLAKATHVFQVVVVRGFPRDPATGERGQLERSGKVAVGDVLYAINALVVWNAATVQDANDDDFDTKYVQQLLQPDTQATFRRFAPPGPGEPARYTSRTQKYFFCCKRGRPVVVDSAARIADGRLFRRERASSVGISNVIAIPAAAASRERERQRQRSADHSGSMSLRTMNAAFGVDGATSSVAATVLNEVREMTRPVSKLISRMFDAADRHHDSETQRMQEGHGIFVAAGGGVGSGGSLSRGRGGSWGGRRRGGGGAAAAAAAADGGEPRETLLHLGNSDSDAAAQAQADADDADDGLYGGGEGEDPVSIAVV